jgi:hypothetical protein
MDSRFAQTIVNIAKEEATPEPYGKVNDKERVYEGGKMTPYRFGWERLKEYFEVAAGYTEGHWRMPGYLDGVKINNKRIPQPGQDGVHWCGIFATWVWIKAGVMGVKWGNPGVKGANVVKRDGFKGIGLGDIAILKGKLVHHFIVTKINGSPDLSTTTIETVNGNSDYQGIRVKPAVLQDVVYYYTFEDPLFNYLKSQYGE